MLRIYNVNGDKEGGRSRESELIINNEIVVFI